MGDMETKFKWLVSMFNIRIPRKSEPICQMRKQTKPTFSDQKPYTELKLEKNRMRRAPERELGAGIWRCTDTVNQRETERVEMGLFCW